MTQTDVRVPAWTVGDRLRKAREFAGLSQQELADELGISRRTVSTYEGSDKIPRKLVLGGWALRCGIPVEWLTSGYWSDRYDPTLLPMMVAA